MQAIHASAILLGAKAVLVRGPSGSGKSTLVLALLNTPTPFAFARLVGDDRINLMALEGQVIASAPEAISALVEQHGLGLLTWPCEPCAALGLVVDIVDAPPDRLPQPSQYAVDLVGVSLQRIAVQRHDPWAAAKIKQALGLVYAGARLAECLCGEAQPAGTEHG